MASQDYYHSSGGYDHGNNQNRVNPHHDTSYQSSGASSRLDHDLPAVPSLTTSPSYNKISNTSTYDQHSPFNTPFDDERNLYMPPNQSSQHLVRPDSYASSGAYDPFRDSQSIPLQSQHKFNQHDKDDGAASPTMAMGNAEQYAGYADDDSRKKKGGWFKGKIPYAVYILSLVQIIVFIVELIKNGSLTGSPIEMKPTFNPMIGPSPYVLINMGARFVPCMRNYEVPGQAPLTVAQVAMPCPNATTLESQCSLAQLCGFSMDLTKSSNGEQPEPNQWFRFILPIFLHGGIIHIGFNMLLQLTLARDMEKQIGTIRFCLVYFSAGIFGFVLGGNYSPNGIASTGCSGSLFGVIALVLLDLLYTWKNRRSPWRDLLFIMLDVIIAFVIGLLPGLDNFSHIGGFLTGLVLGVCLLHSPDALRERTGIDEPPYAAMGLQENKKRTGIQGFVRHPASFFMGRKPLWWAWWLIRAGALAAVFGGFIALVTNFYGERVECGWCKYLNCLPVKNWCDIGSLQFSQNPAKRSLATSGLGQFQPKYA